MYSFNYFDLHCDTIDQCVDHGYGLHSNPLHIDLSRFNGNRWMQTFAFFIHDRYRGQAAYDRFLLHYDLFCRELLINKSSLQLYDRHNNTSEDTPSAILAVEGGHVLGGDIDKIGELKRRNISFLTLVWNSDNELGSPATGCSNSLTPFGKLCVCELERAGITVDVSHLNEQGFKDVASTATKPFIATHSNSHSICGHRRNLKDYQIKCLIECKGLCGINIYPQFVNGSDDCSISEIMRHMEHILSLGGENILAIGTDFDGAAMPSCIAGIQDIHLLFEEAVHCFGKAQADKIFFSNAQSFML